MYNKQPWILEEQNKAKVIKKKTQRPRRKKSVISSKTEALIREGIQRYKKEVLQMKTFEIFGWEISIRHK